QLEKILEGFDLDVQKVRVIGLILNRRKIQSFS
ncbi:MAG: hypothetical protein ACI8RH_000257, partial [Flavobacteriales bacterium]